MPVPTTDWRVTTLILISAITVFRLVGLGYANTDLFVDESQYWLWGQNLDFGYFSKPPLIAWVLRLVTELADSSTVFWIRFPSPIFHAVTAFVLALWAQRQFGATAAIWVAASYLSLPIVAVGSAIASTDTIMAPFLALGLLFHSQLLASGKARHAVLTGLMIGLAMMAKYAGVYFLLGVGLAALFVRGYRISLANSFVMVAAVVLVISPNIIWNLQHDLTTLEHTLDNADWVRGASGGLSLKFDELGIFLLSQFVAMGPILFAAFLYLCVRAPANLRGLLYFSLPVIALVCVQALLSKAFANWAFAAYPAAILLVVPWMANRARKLLWASLILNWLFTLMLPIMTIYADRVSLNGKDLLLERLIGREALSQQIFEVAAENNLDAIVASSRGVLADLFLTGNGLDFQVFSVVNRRISANYYQQTFPFVSDGQSTVLYISNRQNVTCDGDPVPKIATFDTAGTAYGGQIISAYLLTPECHHAAR